MSNFYREVQLPELSSQEIRDLRYDIAGKLVIISSNSDIEQQSNNFLRKLTISEKADLKIALYWLNDYEPEPDATKLEQVQGYLEGFHHLCELSAWKEAAHLLFIRPSVEQRNITVSSSSNCIKSLAKISLTPPPPSPYQGERANSPPSLLISPLTKGGLRGVIPTFARCLLESKNCTNNCKPGDTFVKQLNFTIRFWVSWMPI